MLERHLKTQTALEITASALENGTIILCLQRQNYPTTYLACKLCTGFVGALTLTLLRLVLSTGVVDETGLRGWKPRSRSRFHMSQSGKLVPELYALVEHSICNGR